jgi:hypothetical protein
MGISILDAIPCGVIRADESPRPYVGQDAQGRQFYCLAGQDIPVLSDRLIGWMLGGGIRPLERELAEKLDTPSQGLLSTLLPLADALRSVQETIIATVSNQGRSRSTGTPRRNSSR